MAAAPADVVSVFAAIERNLASTAEVKLQVRTISKSLSGVGSPSIDRLTTSNKQQKAITDAQARELADKLGDNTFIKQLNLAVRVAFSHSMPALSLSRSLDVIESIRERT